MRKVQQGQILPDNPESDALLENMVATEMRTLWEPILRELRVVLSSLSPPLVSANSPLPHCFRIASALLLLHILPPVVFQ